MDCILLFLLANCTVNLPYKLSKIFQNDLLLNTFSAGIEWFDHKKKTEKDEKMVFNSVKVQYTVLPSKECFKIYLDC
jgi:hypothetical protein